MPKDKEGEPGGVPNSSPNPSLVEGLQTKINDLEVQLSEHKKKGYVDQGGLEKALTDLKGELTGLFESKKPAPAAVAGGAAAADPAAGAPAAEPKESILARIAQAVQVLADDIDILGD